MFGAEVASVIGAKSRVGSYDTVCISGSTQNVAA